MVQTITEENARDFHDQMSILQIYHTYHESTRRDDLPS